MKRDIWFERVLWGYMPCHWKGWAFLIGMASIFVPVLIVIDKYSAVAGWGFLDYLFMPILGMVVIFSWIVASRHSK